MADKEATVYIVDVGSSMKQKHYGRDESDLEWAMRYVWDKITSTVATGRKTATVGVVGLKTDGTRNELGDDESFEHITVYQPISQILMPNLRELRQNIKPSSTDAGDAISALVIAIQMITTYCRKLKYKRKIVLITNGRTPMDTDDLQEITKKIKEDNMELVVLGVDFDDTEFGFQERNKDSVKAENEATLRGLAEDCDGTYGTLQAAISELGIPRVKMVRPFRNFQGPLTLGDPATYESAMSIEVERYTRTKVAAAPSASQFVVRPDPSTGGSIHQSSATIAPDSGAGATGGTAGSEENLASVKSSRMYQVEDDSVPGGKREVDRADLAKGYEYGRTAVAIGESDELITKLETRPGLEIIGFIPKDKYERYMNMSSACMITAQKANEKAGLAVSSLVHALFELESYAIARMVTKPDGAPVILLLAPSIEPDYECLVDVQLPFAEDVRSYRFPPLDRVVTVSGKALSEHRNLPSERLYKTVGDLVDRMDLSTFGTADDGKPTEYMRMDETYSVVLHRIDQAVRWRATHPTEPIPPPYEILTRYSAPPAELAERSEPQIAAVRAAADVKKVPPKLKGRKRGRDQPKPLSGLNVDELLHREKRTKISSDNAVPEFKQLLATASDLSAISETAGQMSDIIRSQITNSLGDSGYGRALEALTVMREELVAYEEPGVYNDFIRELKKQILRKALGGDRREMWWEIRRARLGLVDDKTSEAGGVGEDEAREFLSTS